MTERQRRRVCELVGDALDLPSGERTVFVSQAAAEDPEVHGEVLRILNEEQDAPSEFLRPVSACAAPESKPDCDSGPAFTAGVRVAGRYRIERWINAGGMGEVYEAWDERLNRRIALKTIRPEIAGDLRVMQRFEREVAIAREVTHPNVCRVFDIGEHTGSGENPPAVFLTMEYLDGETLSDRLTRFGPMTAETALPLVRQMAGALGAAHRVGVVHRDFKPGNVMLASEPGGTERAVVTDFGLARNLQLKESNEPRTQTGLTQSGVVVGTPDYMAPEQISGEGAGPASDVYALGVVMYQMRTGRRHPWPWPADVAMEGAWARVIERCLDRDPGARPQPVGEVVAALEEPVPTKMADSSPPPQRSWRWWAAVAGLIIFVSAALFASYFRFTVREDGNGSAGKNVAVLAFRAGEPQLEIFTLGLMEAITQRLSQYEGMNQTLVVTPASEIRRGDVKSAGEAKQKLGANLTVEGTLHSQDGRLRLVMAVIDTATLRQVESVIVEGSRAKALSLQDEAVSKLVRAMDLRVQPAFAAELNRVSPVKPGAYEFYLQAKGYLQRNDRLNDVNSAISLLMHSLSLDDSSAEAHAALGEAYWYKYERTSDVKWIGLARIECSRSAALDPGLATAHINLGQIAAGTGDLAAAVANFRAGLRVDPRNASAYQGLASAYFRSNRFDHAESTYRQAIELRPMDWRGYKELGLFYYRRSNVKGAIDQFEKVLQLTPDNASAYNNLGGFYGILGDKNKARTMLEKALELEPARISALSNLTKLLFDEGRHEIALEHWRRAIEHEPGSFLLWANLGGAWERVGNLSQANQAYRKAIELLDAAIAVNPAQRDLYSHRAHMFASLGAEGRAVADLRRTNSLTGGDREMLVRDALSYSRLRYLKESAILLKKALEHGYSLDEAKKSRYLTAVSEYMERMDQRAVQ